ncbi:MAG: hypothetical protein ACOYWZ_20155 [Bacillota bacterium]
MPDAVIEIEGKHFIVDEEVLDLILKLSTEKDFLREQLNLEPTGMWVKLDA